MESSTDTPEILVAAGILIIWLIVPSLIAKVHGRSASRWFIISLFLPFLSIIILAFLPRLTRNKSVENSKTTTEKVGARVTAAPDVNIGQGGGSENEPNIEKDSVDSGMNFQRNRYPQEFKDEVAQYAFDSGATLKEVADAYGVNPTLVHNWKRSWVEKIKSDELPKSKMLKTNQKDEKNMNKANEVILTFEMRNSDSGDVDEIDVTLHLPHEISISLSPGDDELSSFVRQLYGNPDFDGSKAMGIGYEKIYGILSERAYDQLGWHDVTASVVKLSLNGKSLQLSDEQIYEILSGEMQLQLSRDERLMYICG
jgi:transposase-like protein